MITVIVRTLIVAVFIYSCLTTSNLYAKSSASIEFKQRMSYYYQVKGMQFYKKYPFLFEEKINFLNRRYIFDIYSNNPIVKNFIKTKHRIKRHKRYQNIFKTYWVMSRLVGPSSSVVAIHKKMYWVASVTNPAVASIKKYFKVWFRFGYRFD